MKAQRLVVNGVLMRRPAKTRSTCCRRAAENLEAFADRCARELSLTIATAPQFDEDADGLEGLQRVLGGVI